MVSKTQQNKQTNYVVSQHDLLVRSYSVCSECSFLYLTVCFGIIIVFLLLHKNMRSIAFASMFGCIDFEISTVPNSFHMQTTIFYDVFFYILKLSTSKSTYLKFCSSVFQSFYPKMMLSQTCSYNHAVKLTVLNEKTHDNKTTNSKIWFTLFSVATTFAKTPR